ncbi:hypothetical protein J7T55_013715 [Diaporthe amygdali]|uniref:uncharacterized protein n=1 Tax=Phomopsis amygdali TaxID=1214568 RepID=UPI0022FEA8BF|nr:uncharacterized protein J7T55_013715 [Diaporthe amygdali]KAJ0119513.1 hypothetical protein J7T55_013715 [Diaporthe amygdali]
MFPLKLSDVVEWSPWRHVNTIIIQLHSVYWCRLPVAKPPSPEYAVVSKPYSPIPTLPSSPEQVDSIESCVEELKVYTIGPLSQSLSIGNCSLRSRFFIAYYILPRAPDIVIHRDAPPAHENKAGPVKPSESFKSIRNFVYVFVHRNDSAAIEEHDTEHDALTHHDLRRFPGGYQIGE